MRFVLVPLAFVAAFLVARHLGRFLPTDDARHDDTGNVWKYQGHEDDTFVTDAAGYAAVKEAERITREAAR